jgi:hypothetical protein
MISSLVALPLPRVKHEASGPPVAGASIIGPTAASFFVLLLLLPHAASATAAKIVMRLRMV